VSNWQAWREGNDPAGYDDRWHRMADAGLNPHGEADFVASYGPRSLLDAGCGTGRLAIELAHRGIEVTGVDLDADMLAVARRKAPELPWVHADLAELDLRHRFDVVAMAGNVMVFVEPARRCDVVAACARHLNGDGRLIAGFELTTGGPTLDDYDEWCHAAGLAAEDRYGSWERSPFVPDGGYVVRVHRRPLPGARV
jgi:SAM-dependent methyltransferase